MQCTKMTREVVVLNPGPETSINDKNAGFRDRISKMKLLLWSKLQSTYLSQRFSSSSTNRYSEMMSNAALKA